eukprot:2872816-Alexandrium_andersonii.AAC.1
MGGGPEDGSHPSRSRRLAVALSAQETARARAKHHNAVVTMLWARVTRIEACRVCTASSAPSPPPSFSSALPRAAS